MFYEENQVNKLFICQKCNQKYDVPRLLPCGETICSYCVEIIELTNSNEIKCPMCEVNHVKPSNGFPLNKAIFNLMNEKPK